MFLFVLFGKETAQKKETDLDWFGTATYIINSNNLIVTACAN